MDSKTLIARFAQAKLPLEVSAQPLLGRRAAAGQADIVQLDIARPNPSAERFRLYLGAKGNRVEVENVDRHLKQLVLLIHEPRRAFQVFVPKRRGAGQPGRYVRKTDAGWYVEQFTDESKRHFLAGMDEAHLFVAQLPRPVSTVWRAHQTLRGPEVRNAERGALEPTVRQGEWFLVAVPPHEAKELEAIAGKSVAPISRNRGIAVAGGFVRAGREHVADEILVVKGRVYVRGSIRHPDHATVTFRAWRRVVPNTEAVAAQPRGVLWVD